MPHPRFTIDGEINKQYKRFNAVGTQLTVRLLPHSRERIRKQRPIS